MPALGRARDDFSSSIRDTLAERAGHQCSNPGCRAPTSGPREDPTKSVNVGVASHITAAASNGPRYDASLSPTERASTHNAVWLCQTCAKRIDNDATRYSVTLLRTWKQRAEEAADIELGRARPSTPQTPQPLLALPITAPTETNRFLYTAQRVPLTGRDSEVSAIESFLTDARALVWWMVVGSAGAGKSRLALEVAAQAGGIWRVGFLSPDSDFDWDAWQPEEQTCIVIDYAEAAPERTGTIVRRLASRGSALRFPVRVLLLARDPEGEWIRRFEGRSGSGRALLDTSRYAAPLSLPALADEDLWAIVLALWPAAKPRPERTSTLREIRRIDPQGRPLFVAFAADALAHGRDIRQWDQTRLVEDVLEREALTRWNRAGITAQERNFLALATMAGGFPIATLASVAPPDPTWFPTADTYDPDHARAMIGTDARLRLPPLEPDVLGELFVLQQVAPAHSADVARAEALRRAAYQYSPSAMSAFLTRSAMDFPRHVALPLLDGPPPQGLPNDAQVREDWGATAVGLVWLYAARALFEHARFLLDGLRDLSAAHPNEPDLRDSLAGALYNFASVLGDTGKLAEAKSYYGSLSDLARIHPEVPAIRARQARAAHNLMIDAANAGDEALLDLCFNDLISLAATYPSEGELATQAGICASMIDRSFARHDYDQAERYYDRIERLSTDEPEHGGARATVAQAMRSLTVGYADERRFARAEAVYVRLGRLADAFPGETALQEWRADATAAFVRAYTHTRNPRAGLHYHVLDGLKDRFPDSAMIRGVHAQAASDLLFRAADEGHQAEVLRVLGALKAVYDAHPTEPNVRNAFASAQGKWISHVLESTNLDASMFDYARKAFDELVNLMRAHPTDRTLPQLVAASAGNMTAACVRLLMSNPADFGPITKARALHDCVARLAVEHPDDPNVRVQQVLCALNVVSAYRFSREGARAYSVFESALSLARTYPAESELGAGARDVGHNLIKLFMDLGQPMRAGTIERELSTIC
jgi:hypothetical protein